MKLKTVEHGLYFYFFFNSNCIFFNPKCPVTPIFYATYLQWNLSKNNVQKYLRVFVDYNNLLTNDIFTLQIN